MWLSTQGVLRDETGVAFGPFGISRDITDLKLLEEASMTLWDLWLPERRLRWKRGAAAFFARKARGSEELLENFLARVHPEERLAVTKGLARCATDTGEMPLTYWALAPNDRERRLALRARA